MVFVVALLLAAGVVIYVLLPVLTGTASPMSRGVDEATEADARKRVTLLALRDVEYDYVTGKLDERDYRELRREISTEALQAIDRVGRALARGTAAAAADDALEREIEELRRGLEQGERCERCGATTHAGARFCGRCGAPLRVEGEGTAGPPAGGEDEPVGRG